MRSRTPHHFLSLSAFGYRLNWNFVDAALLLSFFLSGSCALVYQIAWQRLLYGIIGIDSDSVTIVVSVFMLGIGLGGAIGGWLSDAAPRWRLPIYVIIEISIAAYGAISFWGLQTLDGWILQQGATQTRALSAFASFLVLCIPTVLMGMTLPLLTLALNERRSNIGVAVGTLYFVNTLGAATGAMLVPFVLLPMMRLDQIIWAAVTGNLVVATCAFKALRTISRQERP